MFHRRKLLAGVAGITSSSLALGTGAFSRVSAQRAVHVDIGDDDSAFLRLEPLVDEGIDGEPTRRSFSNGQTVGFEIPGNGNGENPDSEGLGVGSVYEFRRLLEISNQGTQPVELYSTYDGDNLDDLALVSDDRVLRDDPPTLAVGGSIDVGLSIDTGDSEIGEFDETLTIVAEKTGN
ncbi:hypothetical protein [Halorubrum sp. CSM-61]|uniref:hypothetical protein n=1 Tax=Halorubrum sp. CSM-61 TaxID=2485838 RepID=UPI000F4C7663|nr:hypothetical protein [Halorubrum sp. CSM-61]